MEPTKVKIDSNDRYKCPCGKEGNVQDVLIPTATKKENLPNTVITLKCPRCNRALFDFKVEGETVYKNQP